MHNIAALRTVSAVILLSALQENGRKYGHWLCMMLSRFHFRDSIFSAQCRLGAGIYDILNEPLLEECHWVPGQRGSSLNEEAI